MQCQWLRGGTHQQGAAKFRQRTHPPGPHQPAAHTNHQLIRVKQMKHATLPDFDLTGLTSGAGAAAPSCESRSWSSGSGSAATSTLGRSRPDRARQAPTTRRRPRASQATRTRPKAPARGIAAAAAAGSKNGDFISALGLKP
jgi:hypothetical protein